MLMLLLMTRAIAVAKLTMPRLRIELWRRCRFWWRAKKFPSGMGSSLSETISLHFGLLLANRRQVLTMFPPNLKLLLDIFDGRDFFGCGEIFYLIDRRKIFAWFSTRPTKMTIFLNAKVQNKTFFDSSGEIAPICPRNDDLNSNYIRFSLPFCANGERFVKRWRQKKLNGPFKEQES